MEIQATLLHSWQKYGPGVPEAVEAHLREVVIDHQRFIEIRDYYPERNGYGAGYLLLQAGQEGPNEDLDPMQSLVDCITRIQR